jgi:FkbM family methyltransferase
MLFTNFEKYLKECRGAIHVGAHEGQERFWYVRKGFEKVLYFEPNNELFNRLVKNISVFRGHYAYNAGVHDTLKKAILNISNNDGQSSSILTLHLHKLYHPNVYYVGEREIQMVRLDELFASGERQIEDFNFLNIDVQGVELNVIKSMGKYLDKIDYIYTEVNEDELYKGCCLVTEIDEYLKLYDFVRMATKMTKNKWGDSFYIKRKLV